MYDHFAGYSEGYSSAGSYLHEQLSAKENKVIQLNGEVAELRRKVFDLEETLAEKEQVKSRLNMSFHKNSLPGSLRKNSCGWSCLCQSCCQRSRHPGSVGGYSQGADQGAGDLGR